MHLGNLGIIEKKVLGALLILAKGENTIEATQQQIADTMKYKKSGGAITYAIKMLEHDNYIVKLDKHRYKILI